MVIAIGREAKAVSEADALSYVAATRPATISPRGNLQLEPVGSLDGGQDADQFAPLGPYLVTADQIDPTT